MIPPRSLARAALATLAGLTLAVLGVVAVAGPSEAPGDAVPAAAGYAPDPPALPSAKQWVFEVLYRKGKASILRVRPVTLKKPATTPRIMGRFAIELYVGKELLDRVRFQVPLTGDAPEKPTNVLLRRPTFDEGVTTRLRVQMADNPRASWAKLVDRKTGAEQRFAWPPEPDGRLVPLGAPQPAADGGRGPVDAGASADGGRGPGGDAGASADGNRGPVDAGPSADAARSREK